MEIQNIKSLQVSLDQVLKANVSNRETSSSLSESSFVLFEDDPSGILKAGELAKEVLQVEDSQDLTINPELLDTPENILQAAKSILKYGV
jgi:hypothetical protein